MEMIKSSTSRSQSERKHQSPKQGRQLELPTETQDVLKQNDGQATRDESRMCLKPTTSHHYTILTENSHDGSSSDMEICESVWHSQPKPTTSLSDKSTRRKCLPKNSDRPSGSSSSLEECKSTWKLQSQPKSRRMIKKRNARRPIQSSSSIEMFETLWQPQTKAMTGILKKSVQRRTKQNTDSESSSSVNDVESGWKPHSTLISSRHKISDQNTSERSSNANKFNETWNSLTKPSTSHEKNKEQINNGRNYGGINTRRTTTRELTKSSANRQIGFNHNSRQKIADTGSLNTYAAENLTMLWESSRQVKPNVTIVSDLHPSVTSSATHIGQLGRQQKCSILKKSDAGVQRGSSTSNSTLPGRTNKSLGKNTFTEVTTSARKSPRTRSNTPVYNAKKKMHTDVSPGNGGSHNCHSSPRVAHHGSQKRMQLLQHNCLAIASNREGLDNDADNSERQSPLVRGKTRSRTRYYSTVGAVSSPPTPADYAQWREWPADVGLVYAHYPRDFLGSDGPQSPRSPTGDREVRVHHVLHCAIAVVAITSQHRAGIPPSEIVLARYLLSEMADFVRWPSGDSRALHRDVLVAEDSALEDSAPESMDCLKTKFLGMFGLVKVNSVATTPLSATEEEVFWLKAVGELILHIEGIVSQQYEEGEGGSVSVGLPGPSAQRDATGGEVLLVNYLNQLLLAMSFLYSVVCHSPHEGVKDYIDSQTPEMVTQWMEDMLKNIP